MNECLLKKCDGSGLIPIGEDYLECECKQIQKAMRIYKESEAPIENMIFTNDLLESPKIKNTKKEEIEMKELIYLLMSGGNLEKLVRDNWFLYFVGKVGRGKSQMASTFILESAYFRNYTSKFIDERSLEHIVFNPDKKNELLKQIENVNILVIDDIGVSGKLSHNVNLVQSIINFLDYIIRKHKGLIIFTSNLKPESLTQAYGQTQSEQLISVINKAKRRTYFFASENLRGKATVEEENSFF
jgi:DNA replication protein DnaC